MLMSIRDVGSTMCVPGASTASTQRPLRQLLPEFSQCPLLVPSHHRQQHLRLLQLLLLSHLHNRQPKEVMLTICRSKKPDYGN